MSHPTEITEALQCPVYTAKLDSVVPYRECGEELSSEDGTPRLMRNRSWRKIECLSGPTQSASGPDSYASFNYLPRERSAAPALLHHLDLAHIHESARLPNGTRTRLSRLLGDAEHRGGIELAARIAGTTDWIAEKSLHIGQT